MARVLLLRSGTGCAPAGAEAGLALGMGGEVARLVHVLRSRDYLSVPMLLLFLLVSFTL